MSAGSKFHSCVLMSLDINSIGLDHDLSSVNITEIMNLEIVQNLCINSYTN